MANIASQYFFTVTVSNGQKNNGNPPFCTLGAEILHTYSSLEKKQPGIQFGSSFIHNNRF